MAKHGKNYLAAKAKVDADKAYAPQEAVEPGQRDLIHQI